MREPERGPQLRVSTLDSRFRLRLRPAASAEAIRRAIARLLDEPAFAEAARRVAAEIARDVAADRAVTEIESLVA